MIKIRKKYKKEEKELIDDLLHKNHRTIVLSIILKDVSKVKGHFIYECVFLDNGFKKSIPIVAIDVTQALARLEPHINLGIPEATLKYMLGNERLNSDVDR